MAARFWIAYRSGIVRLTLRPGQTLRYSYGGPTEEGWHRESATYTLAADSVIREMVEDGRDCDGRLTHYSTCRCPVDRLTAHSSGYDGDPMFPTWERLSASQRDEYAEAMGY